MRKQKSGLSQPGQALPQASNRINLHSKPEIFGKAKLYPSYLRMPPILPSSLAGEG